VIFLDLRLRFDRSRRPVRRSPNCARAAVVLTAHGSRVVREAIRRAAAVMDKPFDMGAVPLVKYLLAVRIPDSSPRTTSY
jgi:hypothetical protein